MRSFFFPCIIASMAIATAGFAGAQASGYTNVWLPMDGELNKEGLTGSLAQDYMELTYPAINLEENTNFEYRQSVNDLQKPEITPSLDPVLYNGASIFLTHPQPAGQGYAPIQLALRVFRQHGQPGYVNAQEYITIHPGESKRLLVDWRSFSASEVLLVTKWPVEDIRTTLNVFLKDSATQSMPGRSYYRHSFAAKPTDLGLWSTGFGDWKWSLMRRYEPGIDHPALTIHVKSMDLHHFDYAFAGMIDAYGQFVGSPAWEWATPGDDTNKVHSDQELLDHYNAEQVWIQANLPRPASLDGSISGEIGVPGGTITSQQWHVVYDGVGKAFLKNYRMVNDMKMGFHHWLFAVTNVGPSFAEVNEQQVRKPMPDNMLSLYKRPSKDLDMTSWYLPTGATPLMELIFGFNFSGSNRTADVGYAYYESNLWKRYKVQHGYIETTESELRDTFNAYLGASTNHVPNPGTWNADNRDRLERVGFNSVGYGSTVGYGGIDGVVPALATPNGVTAGRPFTIYFTLKGINLPQHPHIDVAGFFGGGKFFPDIYNPGYAAALQSELAYWINGFVGNPPLPWQLNFVGFMVDGEKPWCNKSIKVEEGQDEPAFQLMRKRWPLVSAGLKRMWNTTDVRLDSKYQLLRAAIDNHDGSYALRLADFKKYYRGNDGSGAYTVDLTTFTEIQMRNMDIGVADVPSEPDWISVVEDDMNAATRFYANDYYRLIRQNMPANCLFFGDMNLLAYCPADVADVEADWVDVMSFNNYYSAAETDWAAYNAMGKPVYIGEFSFPGSSAGSPAGAYPFPNLESWDGDEQGRRAAEFLKKAAEQPNIIGATWYRYIDEPLGGRRSDGENMRLGIVDVTDQLRRKLALHLNAFSANLYTTRPYTFLGPPGPKR